MKIGVLAVQGAFIEHEHIIEKIGHEVVEIRQKKDLEGIDGIIDSVCILALIQNVPDVKRNLHGFLPI